MDALLKFVFQLGMWFGALWWLLIPLPAEGQECYAYWDCDDGYSCTADVCIVNPNHCEFTPINDRCDGYACPPLHDPACTPWDPFDPEDGTGCGCIPFIQSIGPPERQRPERLEKGAERVALTFEQPILDWPPVLLDGGESVVEWCGPAAFGYDRTVYKVTRYYWCVLYANEVVNQTDFEDGTEELVRDWCGRFLADLIRKRGFGNPGADVQWALAEVSPYWNLRL